MDARAAGASAKAAKQTATLEDQSSDHHNIIVVITIIINIVMTYQQSVASLATITILKIWSDRLKVKAALNGKPTSRARERHLPYTVLSASRHKWTRPAITPANQAGTRFTYPGRMEGWVDLGSLIAARPGIEPTTAWSQVRRPNCYATDWAACYKVIGMIGLVSLLAVHCQEGFNSNAVKH